MNARITKKHRTTVRPKVGAHQRRIPVGVSVTIRHAERAHLQYVEAKKIGPVLVAKFAHMLW